MRVTGVIQARMGSTRLPGKVLAPLGLRPLLGLLLHRLRDAPVDRLVVATSTAAADDAVEAIAAAAGVATVRGPADDVLSRFALALRDYPADVVVRITADCPLLDVAVVASAIDLHAETGSDYTSNTLIRTFPDGLDVEVVAASALATAETEARREDEREHVTPFIYRRPERFQLAALRSDELAGEERWTVDDAADLAFVQAVVESLGDREDAGWREILGIVGRRVRHAGDEVWIRPALPADSRFVLDLRNDADAVRFSVSGERVDGPAHERWYSQRLVDPSSRIWIVMLGPERVGQIRVDVECGTGVVSIAIAAERRGQGLGGAALSALQRALHADLQVLQLVATIERANEASLRTFRSAGFKAVGAVDDRFVRLTWTG